MTYTYDEIIPEDENARLVCEDLTKNHHVKFPSKYMTEHESILYYRWIMNNPDNARVVQTDKMVPLPLYDFGADRWIQTKNVERFVLIFLLHNLRI